MTNFAKIFCIDGSGNKNQRDADLKRPIYCVSTSERSISRFDLKGDSALTIFTEHCKSASMENRILIAADVVIGLPAQPETPWCSHNSFPNWLEATYERIGKRDWRDVLIANDLSQSSAQQPFVKVKKGTKDKIAHKRLCDKITNGESVYCIDSGAQQVGRASLQFWFEVLMPFRKNYPDQVAIWPFESIEEKAIVVAECYPTANQADLDLPKKIKRNAPKVVDAILSLRDQKEAITIDERTWFHAVSSEDEYDTFTTAYSFAKRNDVSALLHCPTEKELSFVRTHEGWMLGLRHPTNPASGENIEGVQERSTKKKPAKLTNGVGQRNRNEQENLGPSGHRGPKGPMVSMICRRMNQGVECGKKYETNPQDVFQKKCPKCQK